MMKYTIMLIAILALTAVSAAAQGKLKIDPDQQYLLLSTNKTSTMQKELDEASALGFRIMVGVSNCGQMEMVLFLERVAEGPNVYKYKMVATNKTSTMDKELNEVAKEGFRLMPQTLMAKENFLTKEIVGVMEKPPRSNKRYEYKLLATSLTGTLQKEVKQAEADGYALVGMIARGENMVVMEKETLLKAGN
ncbi:MAG: hypothetical protein AB7U82_02345 [Blastocatellales bacterium]